MAYNPMSGFNSIYGSNPAQAYTANSLAQNTAPLSTDLISGGAGGENPMGLFNSLFGGTDASGNFSQGALAPTIGAVGTLANSWLGFQQLGIAQDQLGMQQEAWQLQKEEFEYQRDRRSAEEAAYAEVRNNQTKTGL